jgi:hypothetical protein
MVSFPFKPFYFPLKCLTTRPKTFTNHVSLVPLVSVIYRKKVEKSKTERHGEFEAFSTFNPPFQQN